MPSTQPTAATLTIADAVNVEISPCGPEQLRTVGRQLGRLAAERVPTGNAPGNMDISIEFVPTSKPSRLVFAGASDAGRTLDHFVLFSGEHAVRYDLADSEAIRIRAPSDCSTVPLLVPLISAVAARKGRMPIHGSAFVWKGRCVLVTGWSKGGKTETLLPFVLDGADYVGDEWLFLSEDRIVTGIPEPIRIWDRQLAEFPGLRSKTPARARAKMAMWRMASGLFGAFRHPELDRVQRAVDRQRNVQIDPLDLFGAGSCRASAPVDTLVVVASSDDPDTTIERLEPADAAAAVAATTRYEHLRVLEAELKHQYLFPGRPAALWSEVDRRLDALPSVIAHLAAFRVLHPHPARSTDLYAAVSAVIQDWT